MSSSGNQPFHVRMTISRLVFEPLEAKGSDRPLIQLDMVASNAEEFKYIVVSTEEDIKIPGCEPSLSKIMMYLYKHHRELYDRSAQHGQRYPVVGPNLSFSQVFSECEVQSLLNNNRFEGMVNQIELCPYDPTYALGWPS
jgi:hypothetical protein